MTKLRAEQTGWPDKIEAMVNRSNCTDSQTAKIHWVTSDCNKQTWKLLSWGFLFILASCDHVKRVEFIYIYRCSIDSVLWSGIIGWPPSAANQQISTANWEGMVRFSMGYWKIVHKRVCNHHIQIKTRKPLIMIQLTIYHPRVTSCEHKITWGM